MWGPAVPNAYTNVRYTQVTQLTLKIKPQIYNISVDKTKQRQINNNNKKSLISDPMTASADAWFDDDDGGGGGEHCSYIMTNTNITARGWR